MGSLLRVLVGLLILLPLPLMGVAAGQESVNHTATFWSEGDPGERLMLRGRVLDSQGRSIAGAVVHFRQTDATGSYREDAYRGALKTNDKGQYALRTVIPASYYGAKHIHVLASHDQYGSVNTEVLFKGDPQLSEWRAERAIVLEETRVGDDIVFVGTFDITLPGQ